MAHPNATAKLAETLIAQGAATEADKPLIEKFVAHEPKQAARLAEVAFKDPRSARYMGVVREYGDAPRIGDRYGSGQTLRSELAQSEALARWFSPEGTGSSGVASYMKANAIVMALVDIPPDSTEFTGDQRKRLMDIAGTVAFGSSMSSEAVAWEQARKSTGKDAAFARDLATLQEAATAMTPANVFGGTAVGELTMAAKGLETKDGQYLLGNMQQTALLVQDGQGAAASYEQDHAKHGPWKAVLGTRPQNIADYTCVDMADQVIARRATGAGTGPAATGPKFQQPGR